MTRWVPVLVVLGWLGAAPGVVLSVAALEANDGRLVMSWLVWIGYLVAMTIGVALWRIQDRSVSGGRQRGAVALAVLLGVSVPVLVYIAGIFVLADPRPDNVVAGGIVAVVVFNVTAMVVALLGSLAGRLITRSTQSPSR